MNRETILWIIAILALVAPMAVLAIATGTTPWQPVPAAVEAAITAPIAG